jgi:hypothetical protein
MNKPHGVETELLSLSLTPETPLDKEGYIHLLEAAMWLAYIDQDYMQAYQAIIKAEVIARDLGIYGRHHSIMNAMIEVERCLGVQNSTPLIVTGNGHLNDTQILAIIRASFDSGDFEEAIKQAKALASSDVENFALALKYFHDGKYGLARGILKPAKFQNFGFFSATLDLTLFALGFMDSSLESIKSKIRAEYLSLEFPKQSFLDLSNWLPLGAVLIAPIVGQTAHVPIIHHEARHDGFHIGGKLKQLPIGARREIMQPLTRSHESMVAAMGRSDRNRFLERLNEYGIKLHQFTTTYEILLCLRYLSKKDVFWAEDCDVFSATNPRVLRAFSQR